MQDSVHRNRIILNIQPFFFSSFFFLNEVLNWIHLASSEILFLYYDQSHFVWVNHTSWEQNHACCTFPDEEEKGPVGFEGLWFRPTESTDSNHYCCCGCSSLCSLFIDWKILKNVNQNVQKEQTFEPNTFNEGLLLYDGDRYMGLHHTTEICFIRKHICNTNLLHRFY